MFFNSRLTVHPALTLQKKDLTANWFHSVKASAAPPAIPKSRKTATPKITVT
jgi:hypothetical protein